MKLHLLTIALDAMPFLPMQLATFNRLPSDIDWTWHVVEGAAMNGGSTSWCQPQTPRFSRDGTTEFLRSLFDHPRVRIKGRLSWPSKDVMVNTALEQAKEPGVLLEIDHDELWTPEQITGIVSLFASMPHINCARFFCRDYVGPNIVVTSINTWGNRDGEWLRAWRYIPGMRFRSHEPPVLAGAESPSATREQTAACGLVFEHWSYVFPSQVAAKCDFYGYKDGFYHWLKLQRNDKWPVHDLGKQFLPWVGPGVTADRLYKP